MVTSPKQPPRAERDWYPYYAGYTEAFVSSAVVNYLGDPHSVIDPWSGSGTTTAACAKRGIGSVGVELNPALTIIARARLTPRLTIPSLLPLAAKLVDVAREDTSDVNVDDILATWLRSPAAKRVRALQRAIQTTLCEATCTGGVAVAHELPVLACFYYTALFAAVRDVLGPFMATNPTWLKAPQTASHRLNPGWSAIAGMFFERIQILSSRLVFDEVPADSSYITGSASELSFPDESFDACLTSPPYATRIDYVRGSLPELAVLGASNADITNLRVAMTGTPVVRGTAEMKRTISSDYASELLKKISAHKSKGSRSYYHPWMTNYFDSLQRGLREATRVVRLGGAIGVVVQDSYYKELRVDLQRAVAEMMSSLGRRLVERHDYTASRLVSRANPRAAKHAPARVNIESLLVFA